MLLSSKKGGQEEGIKVGSPTETFKTTLAPGKEVSPVASLNRDMLWGGNTFIKSSSSFPPPVNRGNGFDLPLEKHTGI